MWVAYTGKEARWHIGQEPHTGSDGPYAYNNAYDQWGNIVQRNGWGVPNASYTASYLNNKRTGFSYDAAGNLTNDGSLTYTYNATGQQATASGAFSQTYDGDGLRAKKVQSKSANYYLRSSVLGGQVVAEINSMGGWMRGYVYLGGQMVAIQGGGAVSTVHQDPVTKSQRLTNSSGAVTSTVDLDPWGGETWRSSNAAFQPHRYTTYERDSNGGDEAMHRRYQSYWNRFSQPDPYDGSYDSTDPQSFNRYAYVQNDPVNFVDPSGLNLEDPNGNSRPQPLTGTGFMSPGIHSYTFYTQTSSYIDGVRLFYPERGPYTGIFIVGGIVGGGTEFLPNGGSYGDGGERLIESVLNSLLQNERCRRAFEIVGLQTINQTVEKGLVIGPATLLNNPANKRITGIVEGVRRAYSDEFSRGAHAGTINNIPGQPNPFASRRDQRPRIFFATSAFNDGAAGLREVMVHELIHAGGQPPIPSWLFHDLANYEWYKFLQESCR